MALNDCTGPSAGHLARIPYFIHSISWLKKKKKKKKSLKIFLCSIKTKVAIKFTKKKKKKKKKNSAKNWLGAETVKTTSLRLYNLIR